MSKIKADVVSHSLPLPKICSVLPPSKDELDEVLAFLYLGSNIPTEKNDQCTPMLVKRNQVAKAKSY